jgi:hypothetical protein
MRKRVTVYWLIPAEPERELFREIIRILAKQFDGPCFEPHLTIFATAAAGQSPRRILEHVDAKPIRLRLREVAFSSKFTKTLFVRFHSSKAFENLATDLARAARSRAQFARDPHVSLLYKRMPISAKKDLASAIQLPFTDVDFNLIRAVRCISSTQTSADVEGWRVVATKSLSG